MQQLTNARPGMPGISGDVIGWENSLAIEPFNQGALELGWEIPLCKN